MSNEEPLQLARKDFELNAEDRAHEKERDVLREIVRNARKHENIMKNLGSLEIGSTYSLFMPLANCDLKQYMEQYPDPPATSAQKAKIVQCAVGLADAIVYLHEELESQTYEKLSCFHMDLKPQNILVVINPTNGEQLWKLSDFNMSRVKMKRKSTAEQLSLRRSLTSSDKVYEVNKLFKRRLLDPANLSVPDYTISRRGTGTYLSPEACIEGHPVQAESDIWSLGCVVSVVFSYLFGGQEAVNAYSDLRGKKDIDRFFTFTGSNGSPKLKNAQVSEAVKRWHQDLRMRTRKRDPREGAIFEVIIRFLDRSVLLIDPNKRSQTKAVDVREKLKEAFKTFRSMAIPTPAPVQSPRSRLGSITKYFRRESSDIEPHSEDWKIQLPTNVRSCAFGPNAQPLVCVTDSTLTAYSLEHVLLSNHSSEFGDDLMTYGQAIPENKSRQWSPNIGVSTQYILARTNHQKFDVRVSQSSFLDVLTHYSVIFIALLIPKVTVVNSSLLHTGNSICPKSICWLCPQMDSMLRLSYFQTQINSRMVLYT
jgi:serine/threonine protein kinase